MPNINHRLVVGMTMSGKSLFAKTVARELKKHGKKVAVLDPISDGGWDADFQTDNSSEFIKWAKSNNNSFLIVDEGSESVGRYNMEMEWLTTKSRHWGHTCFVLCQRAVQISRTVRENCAKVYMFACGRKDSELFAEDWREPELAKIEKFKPGEFYEISRFDQLKKGQIYVEKMPLYEAIESGKEFDMRNVSFQINTISEPETDEPRINDKDDSRANDSDSDSDSAINAGGVSEFGTDSEPPA